MKASDFKIRPRTALCLIADDGEVRHFRAGDEAALAAFPGADKAFFELLVAAGHVSLVKKAPPFAASPSVPPVAKAVSEPDA